MCPPPNMTCSARCLLSMCMPCKVCFEYVCVSPCVRSSVRVHLSVYAQRVTLSLGPSLSASLPHSFSPPLSPSSPARLIPSRPLTHTPSPSLFISLPLSLSLSLSPSLLPSSSFPHHLSGNTVAFMCAEEVLFTHARARARTHAHTHTRTHTHTHHTYTHTPPGAVHVRGGAISATTGGH